VHSYKDLHVLQPSGQVILNRRTAVELSASSSLAETLVF